ncbi:MAG: tetratricopeptide repeat protein [Planctomycetota bacterium]|jgi:tetratricopeptide (TPR) repeat protein
MERSKSITIIFLLAVGLLTSVAPAKTTSVLLQEGLYAEEIEGDLDSAIKIYEQVISESKETQRAAAQATYRIGMCFLKKGDKAKAAEQFRNLISKYPEQETLGTRAREQLEKLGPAVLDDFDLAKLVSVDQLFKSGKVPAFKTQIYDNSGLDLETGIVAPLKDDWPALFDVAWDNDGGGALMIKASSSVRFLALGAAKNWEDAISMARNSLSVLRTSTSKGMFASQSKFVAILTNEWNLAVVQIGRYDQEKAAIYWWLEKLPAPDFGPVIERVILSEETGTNFFFDLDTAKAFAPPPGLTRNSPPTEVIKWGRKKGIDFINDKGRFELAEMIAVEIPGEMWYSARPVEIRNALKKASSLKSLSTQSKSRTVSSPATYAFKTREGGIGILQILDKKNNNLRIRYKMLQQKLPDIETLIKELHNPDAPRFAALNKLIKIGQPAVERLITELEKSNDWQIPKALGAIKDKRAVGPLIKKWQKCDWSPMKEVIAEALERITGKKLGQDKQKWDKWWQETRRFISPEATIKSFMAAASKLDMNNAMVYVAGDSHDYKDTQEIFKESEHPFNVLFRKTDPEVPAKIIKINIMDNMCEAVWQVTFKEDFTIEGKTFKAGETFDIDGNLRRYGDKWLITGI